MLDEYGVKGNLIRQSDQYMKGVEHVLELERLSECFPISQGVRQCCVVLLCFLNFS